MLILKLTVVPLAILALGIVERLHGPRLAGWLTGFPILAAPILLFIGLDHGTGFASAAALGAYFGLLPWLAFVICYVLCAVRWGWVRSIAASFLVWGLATLVAVAMEAGPRWLVAVPGVLIALAMVMTPRGKASDEEREHIWWGLPARMLAGAALTLLITQGASALGTQWSGVLTTFPVMGSVIAVSNHSQYGRHAVREAICGMVMGLGPVTAFCFAAWLLLARLPLWPALGLSLVISSATHAATWLLFKRGQRS